MSHTFTRQELHDLVWSEPMRSLCTRYGLSDRGIAKACARADIPVPERGYWAKMQAGKSVLQRSLPARKPGMSNELTIGGSRYGRRYSSDTELLFQDLPSAPSFEESEEELAARIRSQVARIRIPKTLEHAHPQIVNLLEEDERRRETQLKAKYRSIWDAPLFTSPLEQRRLRILNAIFLVMTKFGYVPSIRGKVARELSIKIGDQYVSFTLEDKSIRSEISEYDLVNKHKPANAFLALQIGSRTYGESGQRWEEATGNRLMNSLPEIIVQMIVAAENFYRANEVWWYNNLVRQKEATISERYARVIRAAENCYAHITKLETARVDHLLAQAHALRKASEIRHYVESVMAITKNGTRGEEVERWRRWALQEADRIDPILSGAFLSRPQEQLDTTVV